MSWIQVTLLDGRRALINPAAIMSVESRHADDPPDDTPEGDVFRDDIIFLDDLRDVTP